MKGNKGITLIALVITIIVLLILAGISIAMLAGENSILKRSSGASIKTSIGSAKEQVEIYVNEQLTEYYNDVYANGNSTVSGKTNPIQEYVAGKLKTKIGTSDNTTLYDDVTTKVTVTEASNDITACTVTITYTGDTQYSTVGSIDPNGKLTWVDNDKLKAL